MRILFVCTGNSCRSPMAEAYCASLFRRAERPDLTCSSAGLAAFSGSPASDQAAAVMSDEGLTLANFRSRAVTSYLIAGSDLVVGMTSAHCGRLRAMYPEAAERITMLPDKTEVPDPYGGDVDCYRRVFAAMREPLEKLAREIINNN